MNIYYFKEDMRNVTEYYYKIILSALAENNYKVVQLESTSTQNIKQITSGDYVLVTTLQTFRKLFYKGIRNFIYWFQGISPEEYRMMRPGIKGLVGYYHLSFLEKKAIKTVKYKIGVSKYLFEHYEKKYGVSVPIESVFIMPCFNSDFSTDSFKTPDKYTNNVFTYAGGLQAWQGFEDILKIYKCIEEKYKNVSLRIYCKEKELAKTIIDSYDIHHYTLDCVPQSEMENVLRQCKFGFIIREDNVINNVATPTKLATYIGNGVIPIFTPTIWAYKDLAKRYKYLICDTPDNIVDNLSDFMENIDIDALLREYKRIFEEYYNREDYVLKLSSFLRFE